MTRLGSQGVMDYQVSEARVAAVLPQFLQDDVSSGDPKHTGETTDQNKDSVN